MQPEHITIELTPFPPYSTGFPIPWTADPYGAPLWVHHFMSLRWLRPHLAAMTAGDNVATTLVRRTLADFSAWHLPVGAATAPERVSAYYLSPDADHTAAIRMQVLADAVVRLRQIPGTEPTAITDLLRLLAVHLHVADGPTLYRPKTNHGLMLAHAVLETVLLLPELDPGGAYAARAEARAFDQVAWLFTDEGVTREHSISYQEYNGGACIDLLATCRRFAREGALADRLTTLLMRSQSLLCYAMTPDGEFHSFGDSFPQPRHAHYARLRDVLGGLDPALAFRLSRGREGSPPSLGLLAYPAAGLAILRSAPPGAESNNEVHCVFTACLHSAVHKQDDDLGFTFYAAGRMLVVDPGYSDAFANTPQGKWVRSAAAHSVITCSTKPWREASSDGLAGTTRLTGYAATADYLAVRGEHIRIPGTRVVRTLILFGTTLLLVIDVVTSDAPRTFRQALHMAPGIRVSKSDARCVLLLDSSSGAGLGRATFLARPKRSKSGTRLVTAAPQVEVIDAVVAQRNDFVKSNMLIFEAHGTDLMLPMVIQTSADASDVLTEIAIELFGPETLRVQYRQHGLSRTHDVVLQTLSPRSETIYCPLALPAESTNHPSPQPDAHRPAQADHVSTASANQPDVSEGAAHARNRPPTWQARAIDLISEWHHPSARPLTDTTCRCAHALSDNPTLRALLPSHSAAQSRAAVQALLAGRLPLTKDAAASVPLAGFDWRAPGTQDRSQLWALHSWGFASAFATVGTPSSEQRAAAGIVAQLLRDWADVHLSAASLQALDTLAWHDHATALRVTNLLAFVAALPGINLSIDEEVPALEALVQVHAGILADETFYTRGTNHGFDQARALYLLAGVFGTVGLPASYRDLGCERLLTEARRGFTSEGVHIENSPTYHTTMLPRLDEAQRLVRTLDGREEGQLEETANRGLEFIAYALRPDGTLPLFGDSEAVPVRLSQALASPGRCRPLRHVLTSGREGVQPDDVCRIYRESGYAFLRDRWGSPQDWDAVVHVAIKCGFLSTFHRHDDDNSFVVFADGEDWLVESGMYKYEERDPYRLYVRSSWSHNIVSIHGVTASRTLPQGNRPSFISWSDMDGLVTARMCSYMYPGFRYERAIAFDSQQRMLTVEDDLAELAGSLAEHDFEFRLHIAPDKTVELQPDGSVLVRSTTRDRYLHVVAETGAFDRIDRLSGSDSSPRAGWFSPTRGTLLKCTTVALCARRSKGLRVRVTCQFGAGHPPQSALPTLATTTATPVSPATGTPVRTAVPAASSPPGPKPRVFESSAQGISYRLTLEPLGGSPQLPRHSHYLEHVYDRINRVGTQEVIASHARDFFRSCDLGQTWTRHDLSATLGRENVMRCFTLNDGNRLLGPANGGRLLLATGDFRILGEASVGDAFWHGTWSIDQGASGAILFCEYADAARELYVWRSDDGGRSWRRVFSCPSLEATTAVGAIRHFHTCQHDPYQPGRWLLSSGDSPPHCRLWQSVNDGLDWQELPAPEIQTDCGKPLREPRRAYRFTALAFEPNRILWPTDDTLGRGRAALVSANRAEPHRLELTATLSVNEMRCLVSIGGGQYIAISEAKLRPEVVEVYHVADDGRVLALAEVPNATGAKTAATRTLCSRAAHAGVFFSYDDGGFVDPDSRLTRWQVEITDRASPSAARLPTSSPREADATHRATPAAIHGCNLCEPLLRQRAHAGEALPRVALDAPDAMRHEGQTVDLPCPSCKSRARTRVLDTVLAELFAPPANERAALVVSSGTIERRLVQRCVSSMHHISLHGNHGDPMCETNVRLDAMPSIPDHAYNLVLASVVLDYIPELMNVFSEVSRVLKPDGTFLFFIQPWRVGDHSEPPRVLHRNALSHEAYAPKLGGQTGIPDCRFGRRWMEQATASAGLVLRSIRSKDPISALEIEWFAAQSKQVPTRPAACAPVRRKAAPAAS